MNVNLPKNIAPKNIDSLPRGKAILKCKPLLLFLQMMIVLTMLFAFNQKATAQLTTGDLAFTSFNADEDGWSLVTFVDIPTNTIIYFTDNEAQSTTSFNSGESYHQWNTGASVIPAGTVIRFSAIDNSSGLAASAGTFTRLAVSGNTNYGLSTSGDTEYAFLASSSTPSTPVTFLAAITNDESSTLTDLSNAGLTNGVNAIVLTSAANGPDYGEYNGSRNGQATFAAYRPLVNDITNWTVDAIDGSYAATVPSTMAFTIMSCVTTTSDTTIFACGNYMWNGNTYTASGAYTFMTTGAAGCDSIANIHLTISMCGTTGPSTTQSPYVQAVEPSVNYTSILSANDSINSYKMVGIPDGLGAYDNGNGTFTLLMNHELNNTLGVVRAHGSKGSFVSKWIINKSDLKVLSGSDLMQNVNLWDPITSTYITYNAANPSPLAAFSRFCSADLPAPSAFYNAATGLGTTERIFMNGEESTDESRAMGHIVTGANAGTSWELPALGKAAWENSVASPATGNKTVVGLMNDGTDGQVYFYIGTKTNTGSEVDKAGLTNGTPWGVVVSGFAKERIDPVTINNPPAPGTRFSLVDLGNVKNITGLTFNNNSNAAGVTSFSRPEDGAWDPSHPNDFYFNTTDQFDQTFEGIGTQVGRSRVWRLRFDDVTNPALGGTIEAVVDGTEGVNMLDNIAIDKNGHLLLNEDVGNQAHNGKVWQYDIATDSLKLIGKHDPARFGDLTILPTPPFNKDEETSGTIDMQDILGAGMFLLVDQAHYSTGIPSDIVEGAQLLAMYDPYSINTPPTVSITSPVNGASFNAAATITIQAQASDSNGSIVKVVFYNNGVQIGVDSTASYSVSTQVQGGTNLLKAVAFDNNGDSAVSNIVTLNVASCNGSGYISGAGYLNIPGSKVSDLTTSPKYPNNPDIVANLNVFEYSNIGDNYGGRLLGYICAPATGWYTFYISGDDQAGLFLSTDENPANAVLIAYIESHVSFRNYFAKPSQKSVPIWLIKGARYYIQSLHKEAVSSDHLSVAWQIPGGAFEGPIPGNRLSPYGSYFPGIANRGFAEQMEKANVLGLKVTATPNPSSEQFTLVTSSNSEERLNVVLTDATGRVIERKANVAANGNITLGGKLPKGIYIVEVTQGAKKQLIKLVKQ